MSGSLAGGLVVLGGAIEEKSFYERRLPSQAGEMVETFRGLLALGQMDKQQEKTSLKKDKEEEGEGRQT